MQDVSLHAINLSDQHYHHGFALMINDIYEITIRYHTLVLLISVHSLPVWQLFLLIFLSLWRLKDGSLYTEEAVSEWHLYWLSSRSNNTVQYP
ncbi:unnamed protein product [Rhizophagus irregularis]|nr:unnamed protein product [Rhizophagus irregularis]